MTQDLVLANTPEQWEISVYVDESKPALNCHWLYIGAIVIPTARVEQALSYLNESRELTGYYEELHFQALKTAQKRLLGQAWLDHVLFGRERTFYFYLLGIDTSKINKARFGIDSKTQEAQLYARTFRMAITYAVKASAAGRQAIVDHIFHDRGDMENHDVFSWHSQWRMGQDHQLKFRRREVTFVDSDHMAETSFAQASHFIQLADLVTGAFRQCIEGTSVQKAKATLGLQARPLLDRLTDPRRRNNPNSRFDHLGRVHVGFWPKPNAVDDQSLFYSSRVLLGSDSEAGDQATLFEI